MEAEITGRLRAEFEETERGDGARAGGEACANEAQLRSDDPVDQALLEMALYWEQRKDEFVELGNILFFGFVDPAEFYDEPPALGFETLGMISTEWLLFEFAHFDGRTPLEEYVRNPPETASESSLRVLGQVARSQFFSRFEILDKDIEKGVVILSDVYGSKRYAVLDERACEVQHWSDGTLAQRIAYVDGSWRMVGQAHYYDRAAAADTRVDGPGSFHPEDRILKPEAEFASFYMRLMRDLIGIDGRYRKTTTPLD